MNKKLQYTLLVEGIAEETFIPEYLKKVALADSITLVKSKRGIQKSSHPSKSKVLSKIYTLAKDSLLVNDDDFFVAGVDLDIPDYTFEYHENEISKLKKELRELEGNKEIVLFVPIQTFDTWLLYIKTNGSVNSLESKSSKEIKKELYGKSNPNTELITRTCKNLLAQFEYEKLCKQSKSFEIFHQSFLKLLKHKKAIN